MTVGVLGSLALHSAGAAQTGSSPAKTLSDALATGRAQASVDWNSSSSVGGFTTLEVTEAGKAAGVQRISLSQGAASLGEVTITLVDDVAYMNGDSAALATLQMFTPGAALMEANRWISIPAGSAYFRIVSAGLTVRSALAQLEMSGPLIGLAETDVDGMRVVGVKGTGSPLFGPPSTPAVLYVRSSGRPLPVEESEKVTGGTSTLRLLRWNGPVYVTPPVGATPFQTSWLQNSSATRLPVAVVAARPLADVRPLTRR